MDYEVGKNKPPRNSQFKKGYSGNPEGGRRHDPFKKLLNNITNQEFLKVIENFCISTELEARKKLDSPDVTVAELIIGKAMLRASKNGNWKLFNSIVERVIGKAK